MEEIIIKNKNNISKTIKQQNSRDKIIRKFKKISQEMNCNSEKINTIISSDETLYNPLKYKHWNKWVIKTNKGDG